MSSRFLVRVGNFSLLILIFVVNTRWRRLPPDNGHSGTDDPDASVRVQRGEGWDEDEDEASGSSASATGTVTFYSYFLLCKVVLHCTTGRSTAEATSPLT
ncbi:hypothetical protein SAY87_015266 [Trapa incisa]|uniref:Uncharacterized protein n=1 Tax=Trapa incisa TaxID=236973 RepID=A0AAN7GZ14_9MYRT|nr:hypothetical protein SAY87_015266 [Trapa incisa]